MEQAYKPVVWRLPDDWDSYDKFHEAVRDLDMTSSPGYPYMKAAPTNGDWLKWNGFACDEFQLQSLWHDVKTVLAQQYEMILRMFIKEEPHRWDKVQTNRWRLIMATPLPVQVVWHMCFSYQNNKEIAKAYQIPSQQGFYPVLGNWKLFLAQWRQKGYDTGLDKRSWDWTVPGWMFPVDLEFRKRMGRGAGMQRWFQLANWLYNEMFEHPRILTSSGNIYRQKYPGIMKSGCVNTISTNSHLQVLVHILACEDQGVSHEPLPVACGDDTLQCAFQAADVSAYERYGALIKSASAELEFVGFEYTLVGPKPLYLEKHLAKAKTVSKQQAAEYLDSMARMYVHDYQIFRFWVRLAEKCGVELFSREYYLRWFDYPEV